MKYTVKFWNDSIKDWQKFEYPYLETALMMANKLCHKIRTTIFVTDGTRRAAISAGE